MLKKILICLGLARQPEKEVSEEQEAADIWSTTKEKVFLKNQDIIREFQERYKLNQGKGGGHGKETLSDNETSVHKNI